MRKYLYLLVIMGLSSLALAQNVRQDNIAFSRSGFPAPGALVAVCLQPATAGSTSLTACAPLAPLCSSSTDAICSSPNPVTADGLGNYHFYVKPGTYAIQIYGSGLTLSLLRDQTVGGSSGGSAGAATTEVLANCTATGTILNEGVELSSQVISGVLTACGTVASASSTSVIGICSSGCGITGSAQIAYQAFQSAIFDNQTVIGDVAAPSSSPGQFTDIGSVRVPGVESVGRIASINSGTGTTATINMFTGDMTASGASNGSGNVSQCNTSGGVSFYSAIGTIVVCDPSATLDGNGKLTAKQLVVAGTGPGTVTLQTGTAPANPAAGNGLLYVDSGTGFLSCLNSAGGSCNPLTASLAFSALTSGTNTAAAMVVSTGASLKPLNVGQVAGSQAWLSAGISVPVVTAGATSSGSLNAARGEVVEITYNTAAGETLPSAWVQTANNAAGCASNCSVTVTAPTLTSGFTGYSVYACEINVGTYPASACTSPATLVRLAACTNVLTNCVITVAPAGATQPPTTNTAWIQPPNIQASNAKLGVIPSVFFPKSDGNYYPWIGVEFTSCDASGGPPLPCGTPVFTHRTFFDDQANVFNSTTTGGKNAFVVIDHQSGVGTVLTNQDRALWVNHSNQINDTSGHYSITGIQAETDVRGAPGAWAAAVDTEVATVSAQLEDDTTNNPTNPALGSHVIRANYFARPTGQGLSNVAGVRSIMQNSRTSGTAVGGTIFAAFDAQWSGASAVNTNVQGFGYRIGFPATASKFGALNIGIEIPNVAMSIGTGDWLIDNLLAGLPSNLNGTVATTGLVNSGPTSGSPGTYPISGAVSVPSSITTTQSSAPNQSAGAACTGGASTYSYQLVGVDNNGGQIAGTALASAGTCVNPLTGVNPATISISTATLTPAIASQFIRIDVYRTAGPMATGKIGSVTCISQNRTLGPSCSSFSDTGLAASGTTPPAANTTGGANFAGYVHGSNTVQLASDFTSAANTSLQTIGVLTWNLDANAKKYSFHCSLMYSQATANVAMQFGIQAATVNPNDISAKGRVDISTSTQTSGVLSNLATTTATSIVTFTPSATATIFGADLDGSIDEPANNQGQVVNIMVQTSNSSDLPTVKRGSYCTLY